MLSSALRCSFPTSALLLSTLVACQPSEPAQPPAPAPVAAAPAAPPAAPAPTPTLRQVTPKLIASQGSFLEPLPTAVTSFGAATLGSTVYVLGGYSGTPHAYSKEGQSREIWALDTSKPASWQKVGELGQALQGVPAVAYEGRICHFGGSHASNDAGSPTVMNSVTGARCWTVATGEWSELPELPNGRSSHAAALIGSTVYLAGGWTLSGKMDGGVFSDELLTLDLKKPERGWQSLKAPFSRRAVGVGVVGKKLVVVGGMTSDGKPSSEVDVYDTAQKSWTKGPAFPGDAFGIAVAAGPKGIVASGRDGKLQSFTPGQKAWVELKSLAYGRFFHQLLPVGKDVLVIGGIGGMHSRGRTRAIEKVSLEPGLSYGQMVFEYPGLAKNRQGILGHGEEILLFGGNDSLEQHDFARPHFVNESWVFDLATLEFRENAAYPFRRQSMQVLGTQDGGISIGGFGHEPSTDPRSEAVSHDEVVRFEWNEGRWATMPALPRGRTQFGVVGHDQELWIFGGLNYDPNRKGQEAFDHDRSIWRASLADAEVRFSPTDVQLPGPRRAFAGALLDGKYVLIGGMKDGFELVDDCLEFDFEKRSFAPFPCPAPRLSGDLVTAGGKLYLVGGSVKAKDGVEESRRVEVYDPKTKKWTDSGFEIPFTTRHMRALPYRDQVLLLSTHSNEGRLTVGLISPG